MTESIELELKDYMDARDRLKDVIRQAKTDIMVLTPAYNGLTETINKLEKSRAKSKDKAMKEMTG